MWTLVLQTKNYFYWQHADGYFNCTKDNNPPIGESGYWNLVALRNMKNDK